MFRSIIKAYQIHFATNTFLVFVFCVFSFILYLVILSSIENEKNDHIYSEIQKQLKNDNFETMIILENGLLFNAKKVPVSYIKYTTSKNETKNKLEQNIEYRTKKEVIPVEKLFEVPSTCNNRPVVVEYLKFKNNKNRDAYLLGASCP